MKGYLHFLKGYKRVSFTMCSFLEKKKFKKEDSVPYTKHVGQVFPESVDHMHVGLQTVSQFIFWISLSC